MDLLGELDLQADACHPGIFFHGVKTCVPKEAHQPRVELFDEVVEVHLSRVLSVARMRSSDTMGKLGNRVLAENLEFPNADGLWKYIAAQHVRTLALSVVSVIPTQPVVIGIFTLERDGA